MILLVDDNAAHRHLIRRAIRKLFPEEEIRELTSQSEALRFVEAMTAETILLAIVDMNLGDGKGTEVIRTVRKQRPQLPIITLSTSNLPEDLQEASRAGSNRYIVKSEDPEQFLAQVTGEMKTLLGTDS